jgi:hypothetical protein
VDTSESGDKHGSPEDPLMGRRKGMEKYHTWDFFLDRGNKNPPNK